MVDIAAGEPHRELTLRELMRGNILVLTVSRILWSMSSSIVWPFVSLYIIELGGNAPTIGKITAMANVAGMLFFASDLPRWMPDARISAVRFPGTAVSSEFEARKEIGGALPSQLAGARAFLDDYLRSPSRLEGWERAEEGVPPDGLIPGQVLREAVRNALMHRDYRAASQTRLFVFDDRVEIVNPGTLLNQLTLDSIRLGGMTQRRNPTVADLVNRLQGRETIGMGIPEMIRAMRECGLPEPELDVSGGHFRVVLWARPKGAE